jgi:hypothetical protein
MFYNRVATIMWLGSSYAFIAYVVRGYMPARKNSIAITQDPLCAQCSATLDVEFEVELHCQPDGEVKEPGHDGSCDCNLIRYVCSTECADTYSYRYSQVF